MPKKSRKMKERAAMRRAIVSQTIGDTTEVVSDSRTTLAPPSTRTISSLTFDYSHIYSDLKRIAFFAGFFFAVLIALSFVIK
jgi:hypothetical protein